jgi:putative endonuclease
MAAHNELGKKGEDMAAQWLQLRGYTLLHRNWRHSHAEVDIIASKNNILHFIEVKARKTEAFGLPEESVGDKKMEMLMNAAEEFLYRFPEWKRIQYDILSITLRSSSTDFLLIEDVFL